MARFIDVVTGENLVRIVKDNVPGAFEATGVGLAEFVKVVLEKIKDDKMKVFRIWGHGIIWTASGADYNKGNLIFGSDNLDADTIKTYETTLVQLKPSFASNARAELRGCQAARGTGVDMMKKLAEIWNVEVHGAEKSQFLITWNPPVFRATPDKRWNKIDGIEVSEKR